MGKKEAVPNRQYTAEFRREAVRLAESLGGHPAAKQLGVPQSTITNWVRRSRSGSLGEVQAPATVAKRPVSELEAEVSRLRRELASAKLDNEILRNRLRGLPPPSWIETQSALDYGDVGQRPLAFWRQLSPSRNLAQGKLRTRLWWHLA